MSDIATALKQALITSKCSCNNISINLEHGESFTCSKCGAFWHARYRGYSATLKLKE